MKIIVGRPISYGTVCHSGEVTYAVILTLFNLNDIDQHLFSFFFSLLFLAFFRHRRDSPTHQMFRDSVEEFITTLRFLAFSQHERPIWDGMRGDAISVPTRKYKHTFPQPVSSQLTNSQSANLSLSSSRSKVPRTFFYIYPPREPPRLTHQRKENAQSKASLGGGLDLLCARRALPSQAIAQRKKGKRRRKPRPKQRERRQPNLQTPHHHHLLFPPSPRHPPRLAGHRPRRKKRRSPLLRQSLNRARPTHQTPPTNFFPTHPPHLRVQSAEMDAGVHGREIESNGSPLAAWDRGPNWSSRPAEHAPAGQVPEAERPYGWRRQSRVLLGVCAFGEIARCGWGEEDEGEEGGGGEVRLVSFWFLFGFFSSPSLLRYWIANLPYTLIIVVFFFFSRSLFSVS